MRKKSKMQKYAAVSATILAAMTALSTYQEVEGAEETKDQSVETVQLESAANRSMLPTTLFRMNTNDIPTQPSVQMTTPYENMYRSELTNEWISEDLQDQRPIAVMVDNELTALPHYGLTQADIVYEMMNSTLNDQITRFMVLVKDYDSIKQLGSVRSVRPTNLLIAPEWNAIVCHDGGPYHINAYLQPYAEHFSGTFSRVDNGKSREFTEYILPGDYDLLSCDSKMISGMLFEKRNRLNLRE